LFGGRRISIKGCAVALVFDGRIDLKTGSAGEALFAKAGGGPFTDRRGGRLVAISYWSAPVEVVDDPEQMGNWAR
jgi:DNA transformation protein